VRTSTGRQSALFRPNSCSGCTFGGSCSVFALYGSRVGKYLQGAENCTLARAAGRQVADSEVNHLARLLGTSSASIRRRIWAGVTQTCSLRAIGSETLTEPADATKTPPSAVRHPTRRK
jgi:hypothetical protein